MTKPISRIVQSSWLMLLVRSDRRLAGCPENTADTFPANTAAHEMGPLKVSFARTGIRTRACLGSTTGRRRGS